MVGGDTVAGKSNSFYLFLPTEICHGSPRVHCKCVVLLVFFFYSH